MRQIGFLALGLALSAGLPAQAQLLDKLQGALGNNQNSGGMLPNVSQTGPANTAGVLQYCIRNNYVESGPGAQVKSALMGKFSGGSSDSSYQTGSNGLLQTGQGQNYNLGGGGSGSGGLQGQVRHKVCDLVLRHAKSLL